MPPHDSPDLNDLPLAELYATLAQTGLTRRLIELARDEDLGPQRLDVTSAVATNADDRLRVRIVAREACTVSGLAAIPEIVQAFEAGVLYEPLSADGQRADPGATLARLAGPARAILALERTTLNLLGRLSGIATRTVAFVEAARRGAEGAGLGPDRVHVCDTRKTTPGLRVFEKYAVRCGGGRSHRLGLHDAVLVKDNHLAHVPIDALTDHVRTLAARARAEHPGLWFVEIEVDTLEQLRAVCRAEPGLIDIVLLDNMPPDVLREGVAIRNEHAPSLRLEASGGIRLDTIASIAATGIDRISTGALTQAAPAIDVAFDAES
ncbi:MAG: carboxylating nicotinate-nucleotide diphosphorylase [Phycisphaerales bacterium]|nr:MAG: carboxylating nicotinate-nucleotide diphosphorylase [Phycisphaerales bacterium]